LDDYPSIDRKELKSINVKFLEEVGYWAMFLELIWIFEVIKQYV
jgi:hypothetical protein